MTTQTMTTRNQKKQHIQRLNFARIFWLTLYALMILAPLIILLLGTRPIRREFLRELSVMLGFLGLSLMGLQFIPTARLPFLSEVFDMDTLYALHHRVSLIAFGLTLAHPLLLFINNPYTLRLLNLVTAPWRARAAVVATLLLIAVAATSAWRKSLEIKYEHWHWFHEISSILIAGLALYHIFKVNYYTAVPAQRILWVVLACIWGGMIIYTRLIRPWVMLQHPYEVKAVTEELGDTWTLEIEPVGHAGLTFNPGQFAWLVAWKSPFAINYHPFSFVSSATKPQRLKFMIKELGDWTTRVKDLSIGQTIYVDAPYGTFSIDHHEAPGYVFIAGGSGAAPVVSMLRTLADREDARPLKFFYGNWSWDTVIYREQLKALEKRLNLDVIHVLESPPEGWEGETGFITQQVLDRHLPDVRSTYVYFICGPLLMIDKVETALKDLGISTQHIHAEKYEMA